MFNPSQCAVNHFEDHVIRRGNSYDYVWCNIDVDVHKHEDFYELFFPIGGAYYHYYDGQVQEINKNNIFLFKPGESHGLYSKISQNTHFSFFAKADFMERFLEENSFFYNAFGKKKCLQCELSDVEYEYINKLASSLAYQDNEYQKVSLLLYNVISLIMLHNEIGPNKEKNDYVMDLVEKMNNYTYLTTRIQDIYDLYPIARCTLIKDFKAYTGMTIVQYQKKQKMTYAAQLLMNSKYPITEIAEILEFDSFSHFLRIFKEQYGVTPKEYRKEHIRKNEAYEV